MLADRSYRRPAHSNQTTSAWIWLVAVLTAAFLLELALLSPWAGSDGGVMDQLSLTVRNVQTGRVWTFFTHAFVHSTSNPFHVLFVILSLTLLGRELEPLLGGRRFLAVFFGATLLGALAWTAAHWWQGGAHIGATAGVLGLMVVLACAHPESDFNFLLFFVLPVTLRPKHLFYGLLLIDAAALMWLEIPGTHGAIGFSPSAHLGGMLAGWIYFRLFHAGASADLGRTRSSGWLDWRPARNAPAAADRGPAERSAAEIRVAVDRILDKINSEGFAALTEEERRTLDEAKALLSRH